MDADNDVTEPDETNNVAFAPIPPRLHTHAGLRFLTHDSEKQGSSPHLNAVSRPRAVAADLSLQYSGRDEYIEIVNEGAAQNLTGWSILSVRGNQRYAFPDEYALGPGVTIRVHSGPDAINSPPGDLFWTTDHIWKNDGDKAELYDSRERLIDSRCYNTGCP